MIQLSCNLNLKISSNKPDKLLGALLAFGVTHIERTLSFCKFRSPPPCTYTYAFNLHPLPLFCELLSIKEPQTTLQNKETTVQSYRRISNQSTSKRPEIEIALLTVSKKWEWIISAVWIVPFILFLIFDKPAKKTLWRTYAYS